MQIRAILSQKGLTGNILETTTAELANATATNAVAVAEGTATTATVGFGTAIKGLGASLKNLALAHPYLLAITAALGTMYGAYKLVNAVQDWADGTTAVNKYNKSIEKSEENVSKNSDSMSEYSSTIEENKQKVERYTIFGGAFNYNCLLWSIFCLSHTKQNSLIKKPFFTSTYPITSSSSNTSQ